MDKETALTHSGSESDDVCVIDWNGAEFVAHSESNGKLGGDIDYINLKTRMQCRGLSVTPTEVVKVRFGYQ